MEFKENYRKLGIYLQVEEKLKSKNFELEEIDKKILAKKSELESLKNEVIELKDFINQKFKEEFKEYDYKVDITNCYIIGVHGKKYIAIRIHNVVRSNWYTLATGNYNIKNYKYYDVLNVNDSKCRYLCGYVYGYDDNNFLSPKIKGQKPDYEEHILEVYPELSAFYDNRVPNTYLKKIYYEINDLGNKKLLKL